VTTAARLSRRPGYNRSRLARSNHAVPPLQIALIAAGLALVVGVLAYNAWQERRARRRIEARSAPTPTR
jgi:hypothetical protein